MALGFNQTKGAAQKAEFKTYQYVDGDNSFRLVGDILARYVYWVKGENDKQIPLECLAFDRLEEKFNNKEKDWVKDFYPDQKCRWAYAMQCIHDGEVKVVNLKKKLFEQILTAAEDLGDPTDYDKGWDIKFKRTKTGPHIYNIEYQLLHLKLAPEPLTEEQRELVSTLKSMDDTMPRPTPDAQKELLDRLSNSVVKIDIEEDIEKEFNVG